MKCRNHPERNAHSCGLCRPCYDLGRKSAKKATCHPKKLHIAKGLCRQCYNQLPENIARAIEVRRLRKYRITDVEYKDLIEKQGGMCAICREHPDAIDHSHSTGRVRGVLCMKCNAALGLFKDSTDRLFAAIIYLMTNESESI